MKTPAPRRLDPAAALLAATALCSCSIPPVRLETPEPVKIDVNVKVEITHEKTAQAEADAKPSPAARRRARMAEVQNLKNSRVIGENRSGYLAVRDLPAAWKGKEAYVREIVDAENEDRKAIYSEKAREESKPVGEIEKIFAGQCCEKAYAGEWIQTPEGDWRQK